MTKNIIVCSDGTGQKGGYGSDSNVYKLYKAVDLHSNQKKQITFYDNGVGTSENNSDSKVSKIRRAISGGFGFGFEENVCDLYRFLAKRYEVGDDIYFFGFSRGAATVRACVGFIHHCGLLDKKQAANNAEIDALLQKALKAYQQREKNPALAAEFKKSHAVHDPQHAPDGNLIIHYVGVWDTVSALGFSKDWSLLLDPVFEALDKLSDLRWPHNFYDDELNKEVKYAYHALAIDDARKTFVPMVFDESKGNVVEQVWFSGVHSNVGSGYPRTGLSDVAFDWMLARAEEHGLIFIPDDRNNIKVHANPNGKLFNSRDGFGMYYRYQPRDLTALCENKLAGDIKVHSSVIERMKAETAGYAPSYMPAEFEVVETDLKATAKKVSINPADKKAWDEANAKVDACVAKRKLYYHIFMEASLAMFVISGLFWVSPPDSVKNTNEVFFIWKWIYDFMVYITPVFFENFIAYIVKVHPIIFMGLVGGSYFLSKLRSKTMLQMQEALEDARALLLKNVK